jgi:hypothetical protein
MNLPQYLTVDHFYKLQNVNALKTPEDIINVICLISGENKEDILKLTKEQIDTTVASLMRLFNESQPKFWPIFEYKGVIYGFQPLSKMTLGEWIDCDTYAKDWKNQLHNLLAVCYRPIAKHHHKSFIWRVKYNIKVWAGQSTSPFSIYDVEPYDTVTSNVRGELFKELPVEIAQGALAFFLEIGLKYSENITTSLVQSETEREMIMTSNKEIRELLYKTTTVGS